MSMKLRYRTLKLRYRSLKLRYRGVPISKIYRYRRIHLRYLVADSHASELADPVRRVHERQNRGTRVHALTRMASCRYRSFVLRCR
jgi:hypothetical protein